MALPLEKFIQQLEESGIVAGETLKDFLPPRASPQSAEELALELVRKKKLTRFQAEVVSKGKGKTLVLGNYVLMEKIGAGGMGQVYKARHLRMDRLVAVKVLPAAMTRDNAAIARFEREVKAAAKISHPNIVAAHDADCANGVHFLVMELVDGSDLSALVDKDGCLAVEAAVNYILQAAKGLEAAHAEGLVHRDIKPANLLLDKKGTVKILDMGLARLSSDNDAAAQAGLTSTGIVMGTVDYMSPEQAMDTKTADARTDIYALGCSLFYLLTGTTTYQGNTLMMKLLAHREQPIPSLRSSRAEVPEPLDAVFKKMVAKKVEDRYQTMTEVIAALEGCRCGQANTVAIQSSETGQPILVQDKSGSSPVMTLPSQTRETMVNSNISSTSKSVESSPVASFANFLDNLPSTPTKPIRTKTQPKKPVTKGANSLLKDQKKLLLIGAAVLGALFLLAGVVINMKTRSGDGTLVVTVTEPDADVEVLNEKNTVEMTRKGEDGPIKITVVPGKHRLRIQKDGFEIFTDSFEIKSGKTKSIRAELIPQVNAAVAGPVDSSNPLDDLKFVDIFNGRDLTGWIREGDQSNWKVDASKHVLTATGKGGGWLLSNNEYAEFVLRLEYQTEEGSNSGVAILASPADKEHLEVQIGQIAGWATGGVWSDLANTVDAGFIPVKQQAKEKSGDAWNSLEMNLHSRKLKIAVNGTEVLKLDVSELASRPNAYPAWKRTKGRIGLQSQKNAVRFRNIRIAEIAPQNSSSEKWNSPAFQQWVKDVQAMPAEKQLKAVSTKLMELNPGFDGKLANSYAQGPPSIVDGVVTQLKVYTDRLSDLSPLRALTGLQVLVCRGSSNIGTRANGGLFDLSPLKGMHLVRLECSQNLSLSDISPLAGMPLREIVCPGTNVSNLTPLIGMTLRVADFGQTPLFDLSPLKGMPLKDLNVLGTKVTNVEPLRGMDLDNLIFTPATILSGLDAIRRMKSLKSIGIGWDDKNKFTPDQFWKKYDAGEFKKPSKLAFQIPGFESWIKHVQAMPAEKQVEAVSKKLKELNPGFDGKLTDAGGVGTPVIEKDVVKSIGFLSNEVKDISPVRALTGLTDLSCSGSGIGKGKVSDLSPINDLKLASLRCDFTQVSNLSPLHEMPLTILSCVGSNVSHLMPLKGMPLKELYLDDAKKVYDLSPLDGMKITRISFGHSQVSDLTPLKNMKLEYLSFGETKVSDISVLRGMPLQGLLCHGTKVSDFSILKELPLKTLLFDFKPERDTEILRSIKTLETINNKSSAEFWKQVEKKK